MSWIRQVLAKSSSQVQPFQPFPDTSGNLQDLEGGVEEQELRCGYDGLSKPAHGIDSSDMSRHTTSGPRHTTSGSSIWGTSGGGTSDLESQEAGLGRMSHDIYHSNYADNRGSLYNAANAPQPRRLSVRQPEYCMEQILPGPIADLQSSTTRLRSSSFTAKASVPAVACDLQQPDQHQGTTTTQPASSNSSCHHDASQHEATCLDSQAQASTTTTTASQPASGTTATPQPSSNGDATAAAQQQAQAHIQTEPAAAQPPNLMPSTSAQKPANKPVRTPPPAQHGAPWAGLSPGRGGRVQPVPPSPGQQHAAQMLPPRPLPQPGPGAPPPGGGAPARGPMWGGPLVRVGTVAPPHPTPGRSHSFTASPSTHTHTHSPSPPPAPRFQVVPYSELRLMQQIGEGGFGKVFYGHFRGTPVAIKVASACTASGGGQAGANLVPEFTREVTTMSAIPPCPYVLRLVAACTDPPALVTEYCARGSLYSLLHSPATPAMPLKQVMNIWLGVARGMAHLHACTPPVLHRDLKSANLLLDDMGAVRIADFGLSRFYADVQALTGGLGTYQWMAPEVLAHQKYSTRADVYSFGIVMWECLTRKLPYAGMTAVQAAMGVVNHGLRPTIPEDTPPDVAALIKACWAAVPDQRPCFVDIAAALEGLLGPDMLAPPPPSADRGKAGRANRHSAPGRPLPPLGSAALL